MSKRWSILARGDVGGFGVSSQLTWSAGAGVLWEFADGFVLDLHYKALAVDYEQGPNGNNDFFEYDAVMYGPLLGLAFRF